VPQIEPELVRDGLVEAELLAHLLHIAGRRRQIADERLHRIARHEMHDQEVDDQDRQHDRHGPCQPGEQIAHHQAALSRGLCTSRRVRMLTSPSPSSRAIAAAISRRRAGPSTGSISDATLVSSSASVSGFWGAPLAKSTWRSMLRPSASTTSSGGYSPFLMVRSASRVVAAISRRTSGSPMRLGWN